MIAIHVTILLLIFSFLPNKVEDTYIFINEKRITLRGNTSVGSFNCIYEASEERDMLSLNSEEYENTYRFNIPSDKFQCGNFLLNKDFQKTLKAKEYPHIYVEMDCIEQIQGGEIRGGLNLTIAGKTKEMGNVNFTRIKQNKMDILSTDIKLQVSNFDIDPPKRFGGLVQTDDIMYITVELILN